MYDAVNREQWISAVFVLVSLVGFFYVGILSLVQAGGMFRRSPPVLSAANT